MKWWSMFQVYSCALVFGIFAVIRAIGVRSAGVTVIFLAVAALSFIAAERERARQRRAIREEIRHGHDS